MVSVVVPMLILGACSLKKNTAATRHYTAFITRYNIYYNGNEHYRETLAEMERSYQDDYSATRLPMHPAEARGQDQTPQPSGDFTRSIEKAQKAIQVRSIKKRPVRKSGRAASDPAYKQWLKRSEYNPFIHNAWLMMGRSQYMNGDFAGAASTFYYISKNFTWLPATVTEAQIWEARSYCAMDWTFEASAIMGRIKPDQLTSATLQGLYHFTQADIDIRRGELEKAIPQLIEAIKYASKPQKIRLNFLLGQLYAALGRNAEAYQAYGRAGAAHSAPYRTRLNARIRQSEVFAGADITPEVKSLKAMARRDVNKDYLDQIYYAIGNLYLSRADTVKAIENYRLAAEKSTRSGIDKALAQLRLGALYYNDSRYDLAQPCYSEAVPKLPKTYPGYDSLRRRSDVLDNLAVYTQNVVLNDSLLRLASMTQEEQLAVVNKIIADLKKKEKEEAENQRREEFLAQQAARGDDFKGNTAQAPSTFAVNTDNSWYFYNDATKSSGRTDFQRRWGSRKLEHDWRRRNKATFSMADFDAADSDGSDVDPTASDTDSDNSDPQKKSREDAASDPHNPEFYLRQIPRTDLEKANAADIIQEGLYNSGLVLKDQMEDYPAAHRQWQRLLDNWPDNPYRLDVYHNEYLMNARSHRMDVAEHYRRLILSEFPQSPYAVAMADANFLDNMRQMERTQHRLYDQAYEAYLANDNQRLHAIYSQVQSEFPLSPLMPKFMFLEALTLVTEHRADEFAALLRQLLDRYPDADVAPLASAYLKGVTRGRQLNTQDSNPRSMIWSIRLTNDSTDIDTDTAEAIEFVHDPATEQVLVLMFDTGETEPNQLLFDVARHNFTTYMVRDFDLEVMNFGRLGLLVIKGFDNEAELRHYRSLLTAAAGIQLPAGVRPVLISKHNFDLLLGGHGSFDDYFQFMGQEAEMRVEEQVIIRPDDPQATQAPDDIIIDETPEPEPAPAPQPVTLPGGDGGDGGSEGDDPLFDY